MPFFPLVDLIREIRLTCILAGSMLMWAILLPFAYTAFLRKVTQAVIGLRDRPSDVPDVSDRIRAPS